MRTASSPRTAGTAGTSRRLHAALLGLALLFSCRRAPERPIVLDVFSPAVPERMDPSADTRLGSRILFLNVFEALTREEETAGAVPDLAESWSNPDPATWRFVLRAGLRFHDGAPVTARDVRESFERAREPGSFQAGSLAEMRSLEVEDDRTLVLRSTGRTSMLPALSSVMITRKGSDGELVGTGPFRVTGFEPGRSVRLERFDAHRGARGPVDRIGFRRFDDTPDLLARLARAERPLVLDPPRAAIDAARKRPDLRVEGELRSSVTYLAFQLSGEAAAGSPFLDLRVRQAVQLAVDAERTMREAAPLGGVLVSQVVSPGIFGFDPGLRPVARDVARARALLGEAGYPGGFDTTLDTPASSEELAGRLARDLAEIGIHARVRAHDSAAFQKRIAGGCRFYLYSWVVGMEAVEALKSFFASPDPARAWGVRNRIGYSSPEFDARIGKALTTAEARERLAVTQDAIRVLARDLPWVPLFSLRSARIYPVDLSLRARPDGMLLLGEARLGGTPRP